MALNRGDVPVTALVMAFGGSPSNLRWLSPSASHGLEEVRIHTHLLELHELAIHAEFVVLEKLTQAVAINKIERWRTVTAAVDRDVRS
ncbi:hypothetical protein Misp02_28660 [Microtetraspora sp. NBRC 16547]|nr:hypothetical protein Misp02_28660 [Microtetraspora sp. NBRC 16547]